MHPTKTDKDASDRQVVKLAAKANLLMALLSQSDENLERHKKEIQLRDDELGRLRAELERRDGELGQIAEALRAVEQSREQALQENALLLASTSWRITAPMRA